MKLNKIINEEIKSIISENNINVVNYDNNDFIDGKIFSKDGGKLIIGKYNAERPYGVIELYVDENSRRKGIATDLIKYAMNYFNDGFMAQVSNLGSLNLHHNLGFRSVDNKLNPETYEESKKRLKEYSSVGMMSPKLLTNLNKYFK